jgi:amino acid permease
MSLCFACLTFLTTIWGEGVVFTWLLNVTGISALLVWMSIGLISLRFRQAYRAQGLSLRDLPYCQPLYPLLPLGVIILGTLMFIAQGYAAVRQDPFKPKVRQLLYLLLVEIIYTAPRMSLPHTLALRSI